MIIGGILSRQRNADYAQHREGTLITAFPYLECLPRCGHPCIRGGLWPGALKMEQQLRKGSGGVGETAKRWVEWWRIRPMAQLPEWGETPRSSPLCSHDTSERRWHGWEARDGVVSRIHATVKSTRSLPHEYPASTTQAVFYQEPKSTDPPHTHTHFNHLSLSIQSTNRMSGLLIGGYD